MIAFENIVYNSISERQSISVFLPDDYKQSSPTASVIWFHGGGLTKGNKEKFIPYAQQFTSDGYAFITCGYRLYPDASYPDFIEDAADAVKKSVEFLKDILSIDKIFIGGSSAGAYLSAMLCFDGHYLEERGIDPDSFGGYIFNSPQTTTHFNVLTERGIDKRRVIADSAAPVYHICEGRDYPRMLFVSCSEDLPNRTAQINMTIDLISVFGYGDRTEYIFMDGYKHCKYDLVRGDDGRLMFADRVLDFVKSTIAEKAHD